MMYDSDLFIVSCIMKKTNRVRRLKFGHPALSLEFYNHANNTEFVAAVGMLRKKTPFES